MFTCTATWGFLVSSFFCVLCSFSRSQSITERVGMQKTDTYRPILIKGREDGCICCGVEERGGKGGKQLGPRF